MNENTISRDAGFEIENHKIEDGVLCHWFIGQNDAEFFIDGSQPQAQELASIMPGVPIMDRNALELLLSARRGKIDAEAKLHLIKKALETL